MSGEKFMTSMARSATKKETSTYVRQRDIFHNSNNKKDQSKKKKKKDPFQRSITMQTENGSRNPFPPSICNEQRARTILRVGEVHVAVAKRAAGLQITADTGGQNAASAAERLQKHGVAHVRVQVTHVQRSTRSDCHLVWLVVSCSFLFGFLNLNCDAPPTHHK
jgi:hypothetical protein